MSGRTKFTWEQRLKAVEMCLSGDYSYTEVAKKFNASDSSLINWIRSYKNNGVDGLKESHTWRRYTPELKLAAVNDYLLRKFSLLECCEKYNISSDSILRSWISKYIGEIISWVVSKTNNNSLVMKTIKAAIEANPGVTPILHSDRGFQYTSKEYVREVSKAGITRSMSRIGRCIDNAPMESFWSHFKDEYYYDCTFITYEELVTGIADYINYYNNERYQWNIKNLTPVEYRNQAA